MYEVRDTHTLWPMGASNWMYGECYEEIFAKLEMHPDRFERGKSAASRLVIEDVTDLKLYAKLYKLIKKYRIGFGFNTFQVYSDAEFDLQYAHVGGLSDGGRLLSGIISPDEVDYHASISILNNICDKFLFNGSAWHSISTGDFTINRELYKPGFQEILAPVFNQAIFQSILEYYFCGQTAEDEAQITEFLHLIKKITPEYHADTYFIRANRLGEERYDFYVCHGQTSPWFEHFPYQSTFFIIDRKLKQVHTLVFAQMND